MSELDRLVRSRRARPVAILAAAALTFSLFITSQVLAVHTEGLFELDENAVAEGAVAGDDWNLLDDGAGDPTNDDSALASEFVTDPFEDPATDHIFAQNSKDTLNISTGWSWKFGSPEDKNDIEHAYTALYTDPVSGDSILYFGIDRMSNNGDAAMGLWFLQSGVAQVDNGRVNKPFSGSHTPGDILVQTDFTQGGTIERLDVYMWDCDGFFGSAADCVAVHPTATLVGGDLWRIGEETDCDSSAAGDLACGQVNDTVVPAPWAYSFKCVGSSKPVGAPPNGCDGESGVTPLNVFPVSTFFEGGLNLTDALGGQAVCLATMVAETRSSQSETSTLDDKAMGNLDVCGDIAVTKYKDVNADGSRDADGADNIAGNTDDEVGLSGWTVFIDKDADGALDAGEVSGSTGSSGTFTFVDLLPGSYRICEVQKTNWDRTDPSVASSAQPCKTASPGTPSTPTPVAFGNTPLSLFEIEFFDLTGATNATIACTGLTDSGLNQGDDSPETTFGSGSVRIGTYNCTITIVDP